MSQKDELQTMTVDVDDEQIALDEMQALPGMLAMAEEREEVRVEEPRKTLAQKILAIQKQRSTIPKSGFNSHHKYHYSTEADVMVLLNLFSEQGLLVYPDVVAYEYFNRGDSIQIIQHIEYTIEDADSGETMKVKVLGQGEDKGDKGSYKGLTGATKYFLLKFVGCPTGDDDKASGSQAPARSRANTNVRDFPKQDTRSQEVLNLNEKIEAERIKAGLSLSELWEVSGRTLTVNSSVEDRRAVLAYLHRTNGVSTPQQQG